jgi:hypothetical protein
MRKASILLILVLAGWTAFPDEPFLFRSSPWGSTRGEVFNREGRRGRSNVEPYEEWGNKRIDTIQYESKPVAGYSAVTEFHFLNNTLVAGRYKIILDTTNFSTQKTLKTYTDAYGDLLKKLETVYNEPKKRKDLETLNGQETISFVNQYKQSAPYDTYWSVGDNGVLLSLRVNKENRWELIVQYYSPVMLSIMSDLGVTFGDPDPGKELKVLKDL